MYSIDKYKAIGLGAAVTGGYILARKKGYDRYDGALIILALAVAGMLLPDIIDIVQQSDRERLKKLLRENKEFGTGFLKKNWYLLFLLAGILYFFTKKDVTDKKQYFLLIILLLVFVFMLQNTIRIYKGAKSQENSSEIAPFNNLFDAELALMGGVSGLFIAHQQTDESVWRYLLYGLLGTGAGLLAGNLLRKTVKLDTLIGGQQDRQMQNRKTNSKILLVNLGKAIAGKDGEAVFSENIDDFIENLSNREIEILDKIYENQQPKFAGYGKEIYNEIINDLKKQKFDDKETETFAQTANSLSHFITGKYLNVNDKGKEQNYRVKNTIDEYSMDKNSYLLKNGKKYFESDTVRGSERWLWVQAKIDDRTIKRQIRLIETGSNRYILYVGIETHP